MNLTASLDASAFSRGSKLWIATCLAWKDTKFKLKLSLRPSFCSIEKNWNIVKFL